MDLWIIEHVDTVYGAYIPCPMAKRQRRTTETIQMKVPQAPVKYNCHMGGVDVIDQVDARIYDDQAFRVSKWTTRLLDVLFRMLLGNAYYIYCYLQPSEMTISEFCESAMLGLFEQKEGIIGVSTRQIVAQEVANAHYIVQKPTFVDNKAFKRKPRGYWAHYCTRNMNNAELHGIVHHVTNFIIHIVFISLMTN